MAGARLGVAPRTLAMTASISSPEPVVGPGLVGANVPAVYFRVNTCDRASPRILIRVRACPRVTSRQPGVTDVSARVRTPKHAQARVTTRTPECSDHVQARHRAHRGPAVTGPRFRRRAATDRAPVDRRRVGRGRSNVRRPQPGHTRGGRRRRRRGGRGRAARRRCGKPRPGAWAATPAPERARVLRRAESLMLERAGALARTLTLEGGKPLAEAQGEIGYAASFLGWFAGEAERVYGRVIPASSASKRLLVLRQPVGVVAAITPWNFPAAMITRKVGPALAAGCTVVLKPAEQTPLTALRIAAILAEAGLPAGVLNVVPTSDPASAGRALLEHPAVRKITFTGSTEVGKYLEIGR